MARRDRFTELLERASRLERELASVRQQEARAAQKSRKNVDRLARKTANRVYATGDPDYIADYRQFWKELEKSSRNDVLRRRIGGVTGYLKAGHEYRAEQRAADEHRGATRIGKPACEYLRQLDSDAGNTPATDTAYYYRIRRMTENKEIKIKREPEQKRGGDITFAHLRKVHRAYLPYSKSF